MKKILILLFVVAFVTVGCNTNKDANESNETNNQEQQENKEEVTPSENESTNANDEKDKVIIAPDFELESLDGSTIKLSELKGKNVIINFWATWCDFCVMEMPDLQKLQETYKDEDLIILAVNVGETKEEVDRFAKDNKLTLRFLLDKDSKISNNYGLRSFPSTLAVNKKGEVVTGHVGTLTYEQMELMYEHFNK